MFILFIRRSFYYYYLILIFVKVEIRILLKYFYYALGDFIVIIRYLLYAR